MEIIIVKEHKNVKPIDKSIKMLWIEYYIKFYEQKEKYRKLYLKDPTNQRYEMKYIAANEKLNGFYEAVLLTGWEIKRKEEIAND